MKELLEVKLVQLQELVKLMIILQEILTQKLLIKGLVKIDQALLGKIVQVRKVLKVQGLTNQKQIVHQALRNIIVQILELNPVLILVRGITKRRIAL